MSHKHFVTDCETTGTDPKTDDILQLAFLEADFDGEYWVPGKEFEMVLHSERQPAYEFAKQHLSKLYKQANDTPFIDPSVVREYILRFFKDCGADLPVHLMGYNIGVFDLNFYETKGVLKKYGRDPQDKEKKWGDFHYRAYEIRGVVDLAENLFLETHKEIADQAVEDDKTIKLPQGRKAHDALYDCYRELKILNGIIKRFRGNRNIVWT